MASTRAPSGMVAVSSHSRMPGSSQDPPWAWAERLVDLVGRPRLWVGAARMRRETSSGTAGDAWDAGTMSARAPPSRKPAAVSSARARVLPKQDSTISSAFTSVSFQSRPILGRWRWEEWSGRPAGRWTRLDRRLRRCVVGKRPASRPLPEAGSSISRCSTLKTPAPRHASAMSMSRGSRGPGRDGW